MKTQTYYTALLCCALATTTVEASLSLTLNFSDTGANYSSLNNDAWGGSTTNLDKRSAFEDAVQAAASRWEHAFTDSTQNLAFTINVGWEAKSGSTLATGGPSYSSAAGNPIISASLNWDNDGSSTFYVDSDTSTSSEWAKFTSSSQDFGGGSINVERTYYNAAASSAARDHSDLYTVALHEIGHTLGVVGGYPNYDSLDIGNDGDLDLNGGSEIPYLSGHTNFTIGTPEYVDTDTFLFPHDGTSIGATYNPSVLSSSIVTGIRKDLTAVDILIVAGIHGFDNINTSLVPEPSSSSLFAFAGATLLLRRRRSK